MKFPHCKIPIMWIACLLMQCCLSFGQVRTNERVKLAAEMKNSMVNELLKQWYPKSVDTAYGGFLSAFSYDFKPTANQDKMIVTQARHIWSNAKAAEMFPGISYYKKSALHGFEFLKNVLWDKQYGGFYTYTDRQGNVKPGGFAPKEGYGNSFAIYALAACYKVSGDTDVLNLAKKEFMWMENHSHDPVYKGYYQHMERDGTPVKRNANEPSTSAWGYKDQNTSIHLLESFTELYHVWPDPLLRERLHEMLLLIRDKMVTDKGYLVLFFQPDWTPVSNKDSSEAGVLRNRSNDHVSFGHDVETAFLMLEASEALGLENDTLTMHISKKMVDHALANGWDNNAGGFYDEGYYFKDNPGITIIAKTKNWWAQAEGLNTFLMMADYYPRDEHQYYEKFKMLWKYVQTYLIDHEHGDWYNAGLDTDPKQKTALKGHIWKGTYHVQRAFMNCVQRLNPDKTAPPLPAKLRLTKEKNTAFLRWDSPGSTETFTGYSIYNNGTKIGYTPLDYFALPQLKHGARLTIKSEDRYGNDSAVSEEVRF